MWFLLTSIKITARADGLDNLLGVETREYSKQIFRRKNEKEKKKVEKTYVTVPICLSFAVQGVPKQLFLFVCNTHFLFSHRTAHSAQSVAGN